MLHPAYRATRSVLDAQRIALWLARPNDLTPAQRRDEAAKIGLLLADVPADVAALGELIARQQVDMRAMCQEGISMAQENTALLRELECRTLESPALTIPQSREPRRAATGE